MKLSRKEYAQQWYQANKEHHKQVQRTRKLKDRYGLTPESYLELLNSQNNRCAICGETKPLHIDHDHRTGRVRGALCLTCNAGLGQLKDSTELLTKAITYLTSNP